MAQTAAVPSGPRRRPPGTRPDLRGARALAAYGMIAALSGATLAFGAVSPLTGAILGATTSAAFAHGYLRLNARWVGLELALLCMAGYAGGLPLTASWLGGSGLAGATAAMLTAGGAREDHQFLLPPMVALAFCALFYAAAPGEPAGNAFELVSGTVDRISGAMAEALRMPENRELAEQMNGAGNLEAFSRRLALMSICVVLGVWVLLLWLLGQTARFRAGRALAFGPTLLLFRVRTGYTFLLIAALISEILSVWFEQEWLRLISYPLFTVCAAGFWLVYLGILLFLLALGRAAVADRPRWGLRIAGVLALMLSVYIGPLVGLADVWFDFRKMRQIRSPMP